MNEIEDQARREAGRQRTAAATETRRRAGQFRRARELESAGWLCFPPEHVEEVRRALRNSNAKDPR